MDTRIGHPLPKRRPDDIEATTNPLEMSAIENYVAVKHGRAVYLALQAALGLAWWCTLELVAPVRSWFELVPDRHQSLDALFVADLVVFVGGSALSAWAVWIAADWATPVVAFTAGGTTYATLYLAEWIVLTGVGSLGLAIMIMATAATGYIAVRTWQGTR